jgi:hypothetical protein
MSKDLKLTYGGGDKQGFKGYSDADRLHKTIGGQFQPLPSLLIVELYLGH